jgi:hypothetical protein
MVRFNCLGFSSGDFGSPAEYWFLKIKIYTNEIAYFVTDIQFLFLSEETGNKCTCYS